MVGHCLEELSIVLWQIPDIDLPEDLSFRDFQALHHLDIPIDFLHLELTHAPESASFDCRPLDLALVSKSGDMSDCYIFPRTPKILGLSSRGDSCHMRALELLMNNPAVLESRLSQSLQTVRLGCDTGCSEEYRTKARRLKSLMKMKTVNFEVG